MLQKQRIHDRYQHVLKNLSATFPSHGFITLLGASGNGKTTVLNIIGGLDTPDSGEVYFNNEKIEDFEDFRRERVSFIFQDLNLIPHLNAIDNVILGISDEIKNKKEKAKEILLSLGLEESLYKRPDQLSGGQQQRVAIARTIAKNVDIIICDEPTGSLDNETKKIITDILKELSKTKLVIFITHNLDLASEYSDLIYETIDGQIVNHSHLINGGHFESSVKERIYDSNVVWLAFKNVIGRYKHTIRYALFIIFIMLIASTSIVIQGEYVKKYIHDISLDTGIKSIRVDYNRPERVQGTFNDIKAIDNVESFALIYNTQIRLTTGSIIEPPPLATSDVIQMTDSKYFEELIVAGRLPEESHEVLMTSQGVVTLLTELGIGGKRIEDQYATGELSGQEVFDLVDLSNFTIFEKGWPKFNIVGLIDDSKIYEEKLTIYTQKGFTDLFEYTSSDRVSYIELPKQLDLSKIIIYKENVYREEHQTLAAELEAEDYKVNLAHEKRVNATYNKIETFFSLSVVFLYVIIAIASISFISLLSASIFERKYEIGLYRTKGYTKLNIMKILGLEMYFLGFISLIVSIIILLITAYVMYIRVDYITSFSHVLQIINIPALALALLGIITVFVIIIVYISNSIILRESVLTNIKDTGHTKKTIKKQVAIVLLILSLIGILTVTNRELDFMAYFRSEAIESELYENRDDFSNVEKSGIFEVYSKEALDQDLDYLTGKIYTHTHMKTDYKNFIASHEYAKEQIFDQMTKLEYMRLVKPIVAALNSASTDLTYNDDLDNVKVFADQVYAVDGKLYLKDNNFYSDIPVASQILSINGRDVSLILENIFTRLSSEGDNETYKYFVLNDNFAINYLTSVEYAEHFEVSYMSPDGNMTTLTLPALEYEQVKSMSSDETLYSGEFNDVYGLLTIKSFAPLEGNYDESIQFIDDYFSGLKENKLDYLILDLRGNNGGQVEIASHLLSYLLSEPSQFFMTDEDHIPLANNHFTGQLLVLQDGGSNTITGQVLALLKDKNIGIHIGQEASTSSAISAQVKSSNLLNTDLFLSIATKESEVTTENDDSGKQLMVDYDITPSIHDITSDTDIVMNLATHIVDRQEAIDDFSAIEKIGYFETFTKAELQEDLKAFETLARDHTHTFSDLEVMDYLLKTAENEIYEGMTKLEFMRLLQPIATSIKTQNTIITTDDNLNDIKIFADTIYAEENKIFLRDNTYYSEIPLGSRINRINGRQASDIIDLIFSNLSSDGQNLTYKYHMINENFGTYYLKYVEYLDYFDIEYTTPDGIKASVSVDAVEANKLINENIETQSFSPSYYDDYGLLKVNNFSSNSEDEIDTFFKTVKEKNLNYLILDLRGSKGENEEMADYLLSYLLPDHPSKADDAYEGGLLVLQDGSVTSTTGNLLAMLKSEGMGTLIGDESAISSTQAPSVESIKLTHTNLVFNYQTSASEETGRGIIPDFTTLDNIDDFIGGKDTSLDYAKEMIEKKIFYGEYYNVRMEGLFQVYSKEQLLNDLDIVMEILRTQHTNLYTDEVLFNETYESIKDKLHDDMTKLEFIRLVTPLVASANCWQTNLSFNVVDQQAKSLGGAYSPDVFDSNIQVFADKIYLDQGKLYLYDNTFYDDIPLTSEIISINGKTASEIIETITKFIPSDGDNDSFKHKIINSNFSWYYFLYVENTDRFSLVYKSPDAMINSKSVRALGLNEIEKQRQRVRTSNEPITFNVYDDYAYLDINTFALYDALGEKNFNFALYDLFMELKVKEIKNIIIDFRGNSGGNPELVAKLLTYLQPVPRRYWSDRSADESDLSSPLKTSQINYSGDIYILMDGGSTAATGHLLALLKYHNIATFIGEESGSTYLSSGNPEKLELTNTNIYLTYSTQVFEVDAPGLASGTGIKPDYEIMPSVEDIINMYDPVLEYAMKLIGN